MLLVLNCTSYSHLCFYSVQLLATVQRLEVLWAHHSTAGYCCHVTRSADCYQSPLVSQQQCNAFKSILGLVIFDRVLLNLRTWSTSEDVLSVGDVVRDKLLQLALRRITKKRWGVREVITLVRYLEDDQSAANCSFADADSGEKQTLYLVHGPLWQEKPQRQQWCLSQKSTDCHDCVRVTYMLYREREERI